MSDLWIYIILVSSAIIVILVMLFCMIAMRLFWLIYKENREGIHEFIHRHIPIR